MTSWLQRVTDAVRKVERDADANLTTESYLCVSEQLPDVYDLLFPYIVASPMKSACVDGVATVRDALASTPDGKAATLLGLVSHQIAADGAEKLGASGTRSGTKSLLWLNRELTFICMILRLMSLKMEPSQAASQAYELVLRPYHSFMVRTTVGNAVGLAPAREKLMELMGLRTEEDALTQITALCDLGEPLTNEVKEMLKANGAHFEGTP